MLGRSGTSGDKPRFGPFLLTIKALFYLRDFEKSTQFISINYDSGDALSTKLEMEISDRLDPPADLDHSVG